jgi:hypothetical protein
MVRDKRHGNSKHPSHSLTGQAALVLWLAITLAGTAAGQVVLPNSTGEKQSQTLGTCSGTLTFPDATGTQTNAWEMVITGGPATVSTTINGVSLGGTVTQLTTSAGITSQVLYTTGGPYDHYTFVVACTGGASPAITVNRQGTYAKGNAGYTINPAFTGPGLNNTCNVDGIRHKTIHDCTCYFQGNGLAGGVTATNVPEDITTNPFVCNGATVQQTVYMGTGKAGNGCNTTNINCWVLEVPMVLPSGTDIFGSGIVLISIGDPSGGTEFTFGSSFPTAIGPPAQSTWTVVGSGGTIPAATYTVTTMYVTNLEGSDGATATYGFSASAVTQQVVVAAGSNSITVTSPAAAGTSPFQAQDFTACVGAANLGPSQLNCMVAADRTCGANGAGAVDSNACKLGSTMTLLNVPAASSSNLKAQTIDKTNPAITVGNRGYATVASFGQRISGITFNCNNTLTPANTTPAANEPNVAIWWKSAQEASILAQSGAGGPCAGYTTFPGSALVWSTPDGALDGFNPGAGGSSAAELYQLVLEPITDQGLTLTARNSSFNLRTAGLTNAGGDILALGNKTWLGCSGCHLENFVGGDGIRCDQGAAINVYGGEAVITSATKGAYHRTAACRSMKLFGVYNENPVIKPTFADDARGLTFTAANVGDTVNYDSDSSPFTVNGTATQAAIGGSTQLTGASFGVEASKKYTLDCTIPYTASAATAAFNIALAGPAGSTLLQWTLEGYTAAAAISQVTATTYSQIALAVDAGFAVTNQTRVHMALTNGTTAGNVTVSAAASGAGTVSVIAGWTCTLKPTIY